MIRTRALGLAAAGAAFIAACSSEDPAPSPPSTATQARAATPTATAAVSPTVSPTPAASPVPAAPVATSPKDATYEIAGRPVTLKAGVSEVEAAPGSASKVTTRYFGNEATGDLNGDGAADVGFILTKSTGGSGTFYYAVVAVKQGNGYVGTNGVLLGDRIAPQTTGYQDGMLIVNYADRAPGDPMTARPSVGVTKRLKVVGGRLVE